MQINKDNINEKVSNSKIPLILDFYSDFCMPCKMLSPVMDEIAQEYKGTVEIGKVNTDHEKSLAAEYGIMAVPTLVYIKNGKEFDRTVGVISKEEIISRIKG
ncbi:MAG: thioredoxin [Eubacterium sp.]|nr:thioredoxin [Eubacterium sp.]